MNKDEYQDEDFVPFNESLEIKELGFFDAVFAYYRKAKHNTDWLLFPSGDPDIQIRYQKGMQNYYSGLELISAPTYSQAFRWFRKKYGLKHDIDDDNIGSKFYYKIKSFTDKFDNYNDILLLIRKEKDWSKIEFKTYEEAELACLKKLIEICKTKK